MTLDTPADITSSNVLVSGWLSVLIQYFDDSLQHVPKVRCTVAKLSRVNGLSWVGLAMKAIAFSVVSMPYEHQEECYDGRRQLECAGEAISQCVIRCRGGGIDVRRQYAEALSEHVQPSEPDNPFSLTSSIGCNPAQH